MSKGPIVAINSETSRPSQRAIAEDEVVTYSLSRSNLDAIHVRDPDLYRRISLNMLSHLSGLLRMTTSILRDASESGRRQVRAVS